MSIPLLLDASAIIAFIRNEPGGEEVFRAIGTGTFAASVLAVQLVEVEGKMVSNGSFTPEQVQLRVDQLGRLLKVVPFDVQSQRAASYYYARRKPYDLSLGDALCLGAAETIGADVMTAEHNWALIPDLPFKIHLIRKPT